MIAQAHGPGRSPGALTLVERTVPVDLHDEHYIAQVIERLSWALIDAERLESHTNGDDTQGQLRAESPPLPRRGTPMSRLVNPPRAGACRLANAETSA
jgi:hypothetical protein